MQSEGIHTYVQSVHEAGGPVMTTIVLSAGRAIVNHYNPQLLLVNSGPLVLTATWAKLCKEKRLYRGKDSSARL